MKVKDNLRPDAEGSRPNHPPSNQPSNCHPIERPPRPLRPVTRIMILREPTPFCKNRERERAREIIPAATARLVSSRHVGSDSEQFHVRQGSREVRRQFSSTVFKHYTFESTGQRLANGVRGCDAVYWAAGSRTAPTSNPHHLRTFRMGERCPNPGPTRRSRCDEGFYWRCY